MAKYSFDQVRRAAEQVVFARPDYVYEKVGGTSCLYGDMGNRPSCIVGQIFFALDREIFTMLVNEYNSSRINYVREMADVIDRRTLRFLNELQYNQDNGNTWGDALRNAEYEDLRLVNGGYHGSLED